MKTALMTITPEIAKEWLKKNDKNRTVVPTAVSRYARDMLAGNWKVTHQGIAFAPNGRLLDGQHRLRAIVESGVTVVMNVSQGVDEDVYLAMDGGKTRTMADRLALFTDPELNRLAVSFVTAYAVATHKHSGRPTADETDDLFLSMSDGITAVAHAFRPLGKRKGISRAAYGAAISMYIQANPTAGKVFLEKYVSGVNLVSGDPALVLREAVINNRIEESPFAQYWKAVGAITADSHGTKILKLVTASRDFLGNIYHRLENARSAATLKGAQTRKARTVEGAA